MAALIFALLAMFSFSGCESTDDGTHNMGNAKKPNLMPDQNMPAGG